MVIPCLPNKKEPARQQVSSDDELHAFDLTWRNYLPSVSQFCCCVQRAGAIRLDDEDPLIEPAYYNDHTLYRGEALQNYLDNPGDWEFESVLGQNDLPHFVTRNPFGTQSIKKKKKKSKKQKKREQPVVMETDMEEGDIMGYDIDNHQEDAEFLGDDQIANLAYNRHSSQLMDQYGEELYYQNIQGPIIQEMQAPPREFYAAKTMPQINFEQENDEDYEERIVASSSHVTKPQASVDAAQALLSGRLDDLTEKLSFIKNNITHIRPTQEEEDNDTTTLHTLNNQDNTLVEQNSICSDIDSITSAALDVYENTTVAFENQQQQRQQQQQQQHHKRYSSNDELHLPSLTDNTPFVSDQHPFTYFNNHSAHDDDDEEEEEEQNTTNVRNMVFGFGKKWLGV